MIATPVRASLASGIACALLGLAGCASNPAQPVPGDRIAALDPDSVCLTIRVPGREPYYLSCADFQLGRPPHPHDLRVPRDQMAGVLRAVSDGDSFAWTSATPYVVPVSGSSLRLDGAVNAQCLLGDGPDAAKRLEFVSGPLRGRPRYFVNDALGSLRAAPAAKPDPSPRR
jgi:hypothetical protein